MNAKFSILAVLIGITINCSAQTANPIKQREQQKASKKKLTSVIDPNINPTIITNANLSKRKAFKKLEDRTVIPDSLRPRTIPFKKN